MKIDAKTGGILLGAQWVTPDLSERDFLKSALVASALQVRETETQKWYEVWVPGESGREVGAVLGFVQGADVRQARVKFVKPEVRAAGASGWSRKVEEEMKTFHDRWLNGQLGDPPYHFPWGRVKSVIDLHGYSAVIVVTYG